MFQLKLSIYHKYLYQFSMDMHVGMLGECTPPLLCVLAMATLDNHLTQQEELTLTPLRVLVDIGEHKSKVSVVYKIQFFTVIVHTRAHF